MRDVTIGGVVRREIAVLAGLVIPLLSALYWVGLLHVVRGQAGLRAEDSLRMLDARAGSSFRRIEEAGTALATLWRERQLGPAAPEAARALLMAQFQQLHGVGNIMLVRESDGRSFFGLNQNGRYQWEQITPDGAESGFDVRYDALDGRVQQTLRRRLPYVPLTRPWVAAARASATPIWTAPYSFGLFPLEGEIPSARGQQLGMTYAVHVRDATGPGFIGIDMLLDDVSAIVADVRPTPSSVVVMLDAQGRLVASSQPPGDGEKYLERPDGVIGDLVRAHTGSGNVVFRSAGENWIGRTAAFRGVPGRDWTVAIAMPESELLGGVRSGLAVVFGALVAVFLLAALRAGSLARRAARALRKIAADADRVGTAAALEPVATGLQEIRSIDEALLRSHRAIADAKRLEDKLIQSQRVSLLGLFAGGLAHDVNNGLGVVAAELSVARASLAGNAEAAEAVARAEEACWKCVEAARGLLAVGKPAAMRFRRVQVNELVRETAKLLRHVLKPRMKLELALAGGLPEISADPVQLQQAVLNLALNARDAMQDDGTLELRTEVSEGGVLLSVRDDGAGMSPEVQQHIFEPFFTTKAGEEGTGLGLMMVSKIVGAHGGTIRVESRPRAGTAFHIRLPPEPGAAVN